MHDDLLDMEDVSGKRIIGTRFYRNVTIREENAMAALEVMSRFAAESKMADLSSANDVSYGDDRRAGLFEHPAQAFAYYRHEGVHPSSAKKSTWAREPWLSFVATRTSRANASVSSKGISVCVTRGRVAASSTLRNWSASFSTVSARRPSGPRFGTTRNRMVLPGCELMPWSAKAQELLRRNMPPWALPLA